MQTLILRKACGCKSPASGPRMTHAQTYPTPGVLQITLKLVCFACDRCNTEWTRELQPEVLDGPILVPDEVNPNGSTH